MIQHLDEIKGSWLADIVINTQNISIVLNFETKPSKGINVDVQFEEQPTVSVEVKFCQIDSQNIFFVLEDLKWKVTLHLIDGVLKGTLDSEDQQIKLEFSQINKNLLESSLCSSDMELLQMQNTNALDYPYSVEDYFARPLSSGFQLSPNGKYLSYKEKDAEGKSHVYVKDLDNSNITKVIVEHQELIRGYGWISEERLVYIMDKSGDENYHIYAVNVDGSNPLDLTPYSKVKASILNLLKQDPDHIIISMNLDNAQVFEPYKLNIHSGQSSKLFTNNNVNNPIVDYDFDKDGNLKAYTQMLDGVKTQLFYKAEAQDDFALFHTIHWCDTFSIISFDYSSDNKDLAYVVTNLDSDKKQIALYDFSKKKVVRTVYSNPNYDVSIIGLSRLRNWEIDYLGYVGSKLIIEPVSQSYKQIHQDLQDHFKDYQYSIAAKTDQEDKYLVMVQSDKHYGSYYSYDRLTKKITLLYELMPQLKQNDMASMLPISFTTRDNIEIHGYITLPKEVLQGKKVPLIVNPHGGPQGIRDIWGFNPEAQLFASRGMATLQVNFRISGGYGKHFFTSGFKQIGRKIMDDLEDGVQYCIKQGWVDSQRIAIYGASHGGYATLMGLIKTPDLYSCGVDYVGVSNIFTFFESFPEYWKPYKEMVKQIWYDIDDPVEREIAKEVSPVFQLDKIKKPLFVVQGANDPRVKISESDQIVKALRDKGFEVPYMVKYDEGHGFAKEQNRIEFYKCMLGFFDKHL